MRILGPNGQPIGGTTILGPDGQPIGGGADDSTVSEEVKEIIKRAKEIAAQGDAPSALQQMVYAFQEDVSSTLVIETTLDLLKQIAQAQGVAQSDEHKPQNSPVACMMPWISRSQDSARHVMPLTPLARTNR